MQRGHINLNVSLILLYYANKIATVGIDVTAIISYTSLSATFRQELHINE